MKKILSCSTIYDPLVGKSCFEFVNFATKRIFCHYYSQQMAPNNECIQHYQLTNVSVVDHFWQLKKFVFSFFLHFNHMFTIYLTKIVILFLLWIFCVIEHNFAYLTRIRCGETMIFPTWKLDKKHDLSISKWISSPHTFEWQSKEIAKRRSNCEMKRDLFMFNDLYIVELIKLFGLALWT